MSKCQKGKYLAGGRCGGSTSYRECVDPNNEMSQSFSKLMADRDKQIADIWTQNTPITQDKSKPSTSIVTHVNKSQTISKPTKNGISKDDLDLILSGDF